MDMSNKKNDMLSNTLVLSIGTLVPKLLSVLTIPVLTTYLSKKDLGEYDMILSIILFVIPVITLQIQQAAFRFMLTAKDEAERGAYCTAAYLYVLAVSLGMGGIGAAVMVYAGVQPLLILSIVVLLMLETLYTLTGQVVRGRSRSLTYSMGAVVYAAAYMLLVLLLIYRLRMGTIGVLMAACGGYLASTAYMLFSGRTYRLFRPSAFSMATLAQMLKFSAPIVPSSISLWIINFLDRLVIVGVLGAEMNAVYSVATRISQLYTAAYGIFTMAWMESAVRSSEEKERDTYYSQTFQGVFRATVGVMLLMFAATPLIYRLLINTQYADAYPQTLLLYFGMFFNSIVSFYAGIYIALKKTRQVGVSSAIGAVINTAVNLLLVKRFGLYAASLSTVISFLVVACYRGKDLQKSIRICYNRREITIGLLLMVLAMALMWNRTVGGCIACMAVAAAYNMKVNRTLVAGIAKRLAALLRRRVSR